MVPKATNWELYRPNPNSIFHKVVFLNRVSSAYKRLLRKAKLEEPIKILEFGCGTSYINYSLSKNFKISKITGIDFNSGLIKLSESTLNNVKCDKELICNSFFNVKLNELYDLVHSQGVVEHFSKDDRIKLLKLHYDATKNGGYCIIFAPTPTLTYRFIRRVNELLGTWIFHDETPISKEDLIYEAKSVGFEVISTSTFWKYFVTETGVLLKKP